MVGKNVKLDIMSLLHDNRHVFSDRRLAVEFTETHLIPVLQKTMLDGNILIINLNGFNRYSRSWLYEMLLTFKKHNLLYALQTSVEFTHALNSYPDLIRKLISEIMLQTMPVDSDSVEYKDNVAHVKFSQSADEGAISFGLNNFTSLHITYGVSLNPKTHHKPTVILVLPSGELALGNLVVFKERAFTEKPTYDLNNVQRRYSVIVKTLLEKQGLQDTGKLPYVLHTGLNIKLTRKDIETSVLTCSDIGGEIITFTKDTVVLSDVFVKHIKGLLPKKVKVTSTFINRQKLIRG